MKASMLARRYLAGVSCGAGILALISVASAAPKVPGAPPMPVVVVIDSGIAANHPAFEEFLLVNEVVAPTLPEPLRTGPGKHWPGWDFVDNDADPQDGTGHGTHVAGLVVSGLGGRKPLGRVVMFRTGDRQHELAPVTSAVEAVIALRAKGWDIPVVLCAFDYRRNKADGDKYDHFKRRFETLLSSGALCVCAAGNSGGDLDKKGMEDQYQVALKHPALIAVAASTGDGQLLAASNYGASTVALAAPGFAVESAAKDGGTAALSGSSQAAAVVAGRLAAEAITSKERDPKVLRAMLLKQVQVHPSLVGRVECAGFLPAVAPKGK